VERLNESGAIETARKTAQQLIAEALESLTEIEGDSEAKQGLAELAQFVVSRKRWTCPADKKSRGGVKSSWNILRVVSDNFSSPLRKQVIRALVHIFNV